MSSITIVPRKPSRKVESWLQVKDQVLKTIDFLKAYRSPAGDGRRNLAIHHSQISTTPFDFFVVSQDFSPTGSVMVIMNAKILSREEPVNSYEACMSFPFRPGKSVRRFNKIEAEFDEFDSKKGIIHHEKEAISGLLAHVFQHEVQHARGEHIYL